VSVAVLEEREVFAERLYQLLPGVYRARDVDGELRAFVALFADELLRIRAGLDQQLRDHFVDSCQDWVIPYLADLVGTTVLSADASRNRTDVKNTIRWRRMKGTLRGLEDLAAGVSGRGAHASEMLRRVVWVQNLAHLQPQAHFALDLRNRSAVAAINTPFSQTRLVHDLRPTAHRGGDAIGIARARAVVIYTWPIQSFPIRDVVPTAVGGGRYRFSPAGFDQPLYAGGDKVAVEDLPRDADIGAPHTDHVPMRMHDVRQHAAAYVNSPLGFTIREDGIPLCAAGTSTGALAVPSTSALSGFAELARERGLVAADESLFGATQQFAIAAVRIGAVTQVIEAEVSPVTYSPGLPFAEHLLLHNPHGTLQLDGATPDFAYTPGNTPYTPDSDPFHRPYLLLRITNAGVAAAFPESEIILRSARGKALQVFLPHIPTLSAGASLHLFVSEDGSTYFARGDHGIGTVDRNPDSGPFGAFAMNHLARGAEAQVRIRPGHPAGAQRTRRAVFRPLCCWDKPIEPPLTTGQIAIDPERGRFMVAAGELPQGELTVDYRYAFSGATGAGPHDRGELPAALLTVARSRNAQHSTIQAAIDAAPDGGALPVVIEILDSETYVETLSIANRDFPGGLVIQASALQTPLIRKAPGPGALLTVSTSTLMSLTVDGLTMAGGDVQVSGPVDALRLRYCTLVPQQVAVQVGANTIELSLEACICGSVAAAAPQGTAFISDSSVQHPAATIEQPQGQAALMLPGFDLRLERTTVFGDLSTATAYISNALLYGAATMADSASSCVRFSRVQAGLHPPRAFRNTSATPIFVSTRYPDPGYLHLHPNSAAALTAGGEEGGEIGVFHRAGLPWTLQNLALRLGEFTPAGIHSSACAVLPRVGFRGNLPT
jgi:hypothetical protein